MTHRLTASSRPLFPGRWCGPCSGGLAVIAMVFLLGTRDYLGLGTNADPATPHAVTIASCFSAGGATWWSWWWKLLFTAVTLSSGFKGGEVTPLFFIGAALGNAVAGGGGAGRPVRRPGVCRRLCRRAQHALGVHDHGIGIVLPNSPGLMNSGFGIYLPVACFLAYVVSGHSGISLATPSACPKSTRQDVLPETPLRVAREIRRLAPSQPIRRNGSAAIPKTPSSERCKVT